MAQNVSRQTAEEMEDLIVAWAIQLVRKLKRNIQRKGLVNKGHFRDSVHYRLRFDEATLSVFLVISYTFYGDFYRSGYKPSGKMGKRAAGAIAKWIKESGLDSMISAYRKKWGHVGLSDARIRNKIAWGIMRKKAQRATRIRKNWWPNRQNDAERLLNQLGAQLLEESGTIFNKIYPKQR